MRQFVVKLFVVVVSLVAADRLAGYWLERLYFAQKGEDYRYATKALDEQEAELLVLGSSRARNHYDATLIGDSLGLTAYNCGRSGHFMAYQSAQLDMILDRYTPKVVLLDITPYDLEGSGGNGEYDILGSLLPYDRHASWSRILRKRSWYEPLKAMSRTYRYNSMLLKLVNNTGTADNGGFHADGFQPLDGSLAQGDTALIETGSTNGHISPNMQSELEHIIDVCRMRGISLVAVTSPYHARYTRTATIAVADSLCQASGVPYRSWLNEVDFNDATLYYTADHLNGIGAEKYSEQVAVWLSEIINGAE